MDGFSIRKAIESDAAGVAKVKYWGWQHTYKGIISDAYLQSMNLEELENTWTKILSPKNVATKTNVLVNSANEVVGFVSHGKSRSEQIKVDGEIFALYLLKEYHGKGLGAQLFLHAAGELKKEGSKSLCLFVLTENPTINFYRKFNPDMEAQEMIEIDGEQYSDTVLGWSNINALLS